MRDVVTMVKTSKPAKAIQTKNKALKTTAKKDTLKTVVIFNSSL